jgi:hypothetical protein
VSLHLGTPLCECLTKSEPPQLGKLRHLLFATSTWCALIFIIIHRALAGLAWTGSDRSPLLEFLLPPHSAGIGEIAIERKEKEDVLDLGIDRVVKALDRVGARDARHVGKFDRQRDTAQPARPAGAG